MLGRGALPGIVTVALFNLRTGNLGSVDFGALQAGVVTSALPCEGVS